MLLSERPRKKVGGRSGRLRRKLEGADHAFFTASGMMSHDIGTTFVAQGFFADEFSGCVFVHPPRDSTLNSHVDEGISAAAMVAKSPASVQRAAADYCK